MGPKGYLLFCFLFIANYSITSGTEASIHTYSTESLTESLHRSNFPADFIFGTASSSYQYEGGANEGGRGPSIWDTFTHKYPGKITDGSNGDVGVDSYHRYEEDVGIMKEIGLDAYRFSISWPRVLPNGKISGGVNTEGIEYYNNLINELLKKGIKPYVTLFHWDLPQALDDEYGGFLSHEIVEDYKDYADLCFQKFGDRVKHWITFNEPWYYTTKGYALGVTAPGRCSSCLQMNCTGGDSGTEPYIVGHHQLLAHAATSKLYKQKYQVELDNPWALQDGEIGITLVTHWMVPFSEARENQNAALRALEFMFGWFMDPLTTGDYPHIMRTLVGNRLPNFSKEQSEMLKGSMDFLGLNYYTANYAEHAPDSHTVNPSYITDSQVNLTTEKDGIPIGPKGGSDWLSDYPRGIYDTLHYIKQKYNNPPIYITENGCDELNNATLSLEEALDDKKRVDYFYGHLSFLLQAIKEGANVKGYFAWSLLDNFEWMSGYTLRFGINYVDFNDGLKRYPKLSAKWFKNFLKQEDMQFELGVDAETILVCKTFREVCSM